MFSWLISFPASGPLHQQDTGHCCRVGQIGPKQDNMKPGLRILIIWLQTQVTVKEVEIWWGC